MTSGALELKPIGWVESPLVDREQAPKQGNEGSPEAWLVFEPAFSEGFRDLQPGSTPVSPGRLAPRGARVSLTAGAPSGEPVTVQP